LSIEKYISASTERLCKYTRTKYQIRMLFPLFVYTFCSNNWFPSYNFVDFIHENNTNVSWNIARYFIHRTVNNWHWWNNVQTGWHYNA